MTSTLSIQNAYDLSIANLPEQLSDLTEQFSPDVRFVSPESFYQLISDSRVLIAQSVFQPESIQGMIRYESRGAGFIEIGGVLSSGSGIGRKLLAAALAENSTKAATFMLVTRVEKQQMIHLAEDFGFQFYKNGEIAQLTSADARTAAEMCYYKDASDHADDAGRVIGIRPASAL